MATTLFWGAVLRVCQAMVQAAPTLLVGLLVAGLLHRFLGRDNTRKLFGDDTWRSLPQAWLLGMLLPVCSLGVIPVVRVVRRCGVSGGTILAFALTAPLFNPISVLYGLTLADPLVIITFSLCSLAIVTFVGLAWDRIFPRSVIDERLPPPAPVGIKRIISVVVFAARELTGPSLVYILIGLAGVALLALVLPSGSLQTSAEHADPWAPLFMAVVALPAYATPMVAMVQLSSMFQHGNSVGACFVLLAFGAGANLGLVAWILWNYGIRRGMAWFGILFAVVVALAYGVERPLYPRGVEPAGHTHAFDGYCAPFRDGGSGGPQAVWTILREKLAAHELVALGCLAALAALGVGLRLADPGRRVEDWLERAPLRAGRYDMVLPPAAVGGAGIAGVIVLSILGCYIYYPSPDEIFKEMRIADVEVYVAATTQHWDNALYWIPIFDDWSRKLEVSLFLRGGDISEYRRIKGEILRERLELLEHEVEDHEVAETREVAEQVHRAYQRLRKAYEDVLSAPH